MGITTTVNLSTKRWQRAAAAALALAGLLGGGKTAYACDIPPYECQVTYLKWLEPIYKAVVCAAKVLANSSALIDVDIQVEVPMLGSLEKIVKSTQGILTEANTTLDFYKAAEQKVKALTRLSPADLIRIKIDVVSDTSGSNAALGQWMDVMNGVTDSVGQLENFAKSFDGIYIDVQGKAGASTHMEQVADEQYTNFEFGAAWKDVMLPEYRKVEDAFAARRGLTMKQFAHAGGMSYNRHEENSASFSLLGGVLVVDEHTENTASLQAAAHEAKGITHEARAASRVMGDAAEASYDGSARQLEVESAAYSAVPKRLKAIGDRVEEEVSGDNQTTLFPELQ